MIAMKFRDGIVVLIVVVCSVVVRVTAQEGKRSYNMAWETRHDSQARAIALNHKLEGGK